MSGRREPRDVLCLTAIDTCSNVAVDCRVFAHSNRPVVCFLYRNHGVGICRRSAKMEKKSVSFGLIVSSWYLRSVSASPNCFPIDRSSAIRCWIRETLMMTQFNYSSLLSGKSLRKRRTENILFEVSPFVENYTTNLLESDWNSLFEIFSRASIG